MTDDKQRLELIYLLAESMDNERYKTTLIKNLNGMLNIESAGDKSEFFKGIQHLPYSNTEEAN